MVRSPRKRRFCKPLLFVGLLVQLGVLAQASQISGTAKDEQGKSIAGASVVLTASATQTKRTAATNREGRYVFESIEPGDYTIEVNATGFKAGTVAGVKLAEGESVDENFDLILASRAEAITVEGVQPGVDNYVVTNNVTGGKAELPITDIAQDIVIIPRRVLEEQNSPNLDTALKNVAGYAQSGQASYIPVGNYALIRGFTVSNSIKDALYDDTNTANIPYLGNVEQVEILKGASSLLYGPPWGGLGGIVNVTTKKPLREPVYTLGLGLDTFGSISPYLDLSQPLTDNWAVRLIGDGSRTQSFIRNFEQTPWDASVLISGNIKAKTTLNVLIERLSLGRQQYGGVPLFTSTGASFPFGFPTDFNTYDSKSTSRTNSERIQAAIVHRFTDAWNLRFTGEGNRSTNRNWEYYPTYNDTGGGVYNYGYNDFYRSTWTYDVTLNGKFKTGPLRHTLTIGQSYMPVHSRSMGLYPPSPPSWGFTNPLLPPANLAGPAGPIPPSYTYDNNRTVVYANDIMAVTQRIKISAGVSYTNGTSIFPSNHWHVDDKGAGWRVGPIVRITQNSYLFMDYSTAFIPQSPASLASSNGAANIYYYPPLTGRQIETGYKLSITNRAAVTAALYQLTEENVTTPSLDPVKLVQGIRDVSGEQRSRGAELDATYRLTSGWNVLSSYGYTNAIVTKNNSTSSDNAIGSTIAMVPRNSGRIWTTYEIQSGPLRGLGLGGGLYAQTKRRTNIPTNAHPSYFGVIGGYAALDALAYYTVAGWKVSANVTNVLDRHYWETAFLTAAFPGQPVSCSFRIQKTFGGESVWRP